MEPPSLGGIFSTKKRQCTKNKQKQTCYCSYNKIWLLDGLESERPEMIRSRKIKLQHYTQKESLTFLDDNTLLIADERAAGKGPFLYRLELDVKPDTEGDP